MDFPHLHLCLYVPVEIMLVLVNFPFNLNFVEVFGGLVTFTHFLKTLVEFLFGKYTFWNVGKIVITWLIRR